MEIIRNPEYPAGMRLDTAFVYLFGSDVTEAELNSIKTYADYIKLVSKARSRPKIYYVGNSLEFSVFTVHGFQGGLYHSVPLPTETYVRNKDYTARQDIISGTRCHNDASVFRPTMSKLARVCNRQRVTQDGSADFYLDVDPGRSPLTSDASIYSSRTYRALQYGLREDFVPNASANNVISFTGGGSGGGYARVLFKPSTWTIDAEDNLEKVTEFNSTYTLQANGSSYAGYNVNFGYPVPANADILTWTAGYYRSSSNANVNFMFDSIGLACSNPDDGDVTITWGFCIEQVMDDYIVFRVFRAGEDFDATSVGVPRRVSSTLAEPIPITCYEGRTGSLVARGLGAAKAKIEAGAPSGFHFSSYSLDVSAFKRPASLEPIIQHPTYMYAIGLNGLHADGMIKARTSKRSPIMSYKAFESSPNARLVCTVAFPMSGTLDEFLVEYDSIAIDCQEAGRDVIVLSIGRDAGNDLVVSEANIDPATGTLMFTINKALPSAA